MTVRQNRRLLVTLAALAVLVLGVVAFLVWWQNTRPRVAIHQELSLPGPGSEVYRKMVAAFYAGVAALDVDANERAKESLQSATQIVPEEPAAWADRGLLYLRLNDFDTAQHDLDRAQTLAPDNGAIKRLIGLLESRRGRFAEAIAHLRKAVELDPNDLKATYSLVHEIERQGEPDSEAEILRLTGEILKRQPENLVVLLERARLAVKIGDAQVLSEVLTALARLAPSWPSKAQEPFRILQTTAQTNIRQAATRVAFLRNLLVREPEYRKSLAAVETPLGMVGEPIRHFLKLPSPPSLPSPPDESIRFTVEPIAEKNALWCEALIAVSLTGKEPPALFAANGRELRRVGESAITLSFPGGPKETPPSPHGILTLDLNSDYLIDFVLAGAGGLRIYQQKPDGTFVDVAAASKLEPAVLSQDYFGTWVIDIEMDGDLDIVVAPRNGSPSVLRNNNDGSFSVAEPFDKAANVRDFVWADLDQDGDQDVAFLDDQHQLQFYTNERAGRFLPQTPPEGLGKLLALSVADINSDGSLELLALRSDGGISRLLRNEGNPPWTVSEVVKHAPPAEGTAQLFAGDLDNNGSVDLVASTASGSWIALGDGKEAPRIKDALSDLRVSVVADLTNDGRLDLAGIVAGGKPARGIGSGSKAYHWQVVRPRAAKVFGDGRINSFGLGGEIDVRAGLLIQKQAIAGSSVHFGLGDHPSSDVARITWPNGTVQAEFDAKSDQVVVAEQRLKGSCPFLFAFDGSAVRFVTDVIWRSPLGLRINAQDTAGVGQTEDWVKIRGDQLKPRDGYYDLRVTAELWETHYFDQMALLVVDHPADTEVFVDERFARQPPPLAVHPTETCLPIARARDDQGRDVTDLIRSRDGRYVDTFGRGPYQGVTRDHWIELEIDDSVPRDRPLRLIANGWIHPTDSSINVALGQGHHEPPRGLVLEVPSDHGTWQVARPDLGFPAGKQKTIMIDLDGVFAPGAPRRFRLRTNLEVFWDSLNVAVPTSNDSLKIVRLAPESAELRPRGYSLMTQANESSPELPEYNQLTGSSQRWRDLIGYYTRFGDVRELVEQVDDRYIIANAGDELALRFKAPPSPPQGWIRDFVFIGDGWNKDGDYNTAFSKTVLPLPSHKQGPYNTPPGALEDDPVYRVHADDWRKYHTRHITSDVFQTRPWPQGFVPSRGRSESSR